MQSLYLVVRVVLVITATGLQSTYSVPTPQTDACEGEQITIQPNDDKCFQLPQNIADYCNYTHTVLPNTRGHKTVKEALSEFNEFARLLHSNCSEYLGTLLCFHYFPFSNCSVNSSVPTGSSKIQIYPCRATCEAAKNPACTAFIYSRGFYWAEHLDCSRTEFDVSLQNCAYGPNTRTYCQTPPCLPPIMPTSPTVPMTKPTKKPIGGKNVTEEEYTAGEFSEASCTVLFCID